MKAALFDFCNTLADFSTADAFIEFVLSCLNEKERKQRIKKHDFLCKIKLVRLHDIMVSLGILKNKVSLNKRLYLEAIAGIPYADMERYAGLYYKEKIRPHLIKETVAELRQRQAEGFRIGIVSGGYDMYLKYFAREYDVDDLICTRIGFKDGKATGRIEGTDCMDGRKVLLLDAYYDDAQIDRGASYAYSDSRSDLPLLKWAGNGVAVSPNAEPGWAKKNGLRCLIWKN